MTDDPKVPEITPLPPPEPPKAPEPPPPPKSPDPEPDPELTAQVKKNAAYFARNPEVFEGVLEELEHSGVVAVRQEVNELKLQIALRDAITETGLTKEDIPFVTGGTPEELMSSATALKARYDKIKPAEPGTEPGTGGNNVIKIKPAGSLIQVQEGKLKESIPSLPEHREGMSSEAQLEAELRETMQGLKFEI